MTTLRLGHRQTDLLRRLAAAGERGLLIYGDTDFAAMRSLGRRRLAEWIKGVPRGARATPAGREAVPEGR